MSQAAEKCDSHILGRPEYYGIGIRAGIYAQIIAVYLSRLFISRNADALRLGAHAFSLALFATTLIFTANISQTYTIEVFIILQLLTWMSFTDVRTLRHTTSFASKSGLLRTIVTLVQRAAVLSLNIWFWFSGIDETKRVCETSVFFFAKLDVFGWFRYLMAAMSILSVLVYVYSFYWLLLDFLSQENIGNSDDAKAAVVAFTLSQTIQQDLQKEQSRQATPKLGYRMAATSQRSLVPTRSRSDSDSSWKTITTLTDTESMTQRIERIRQSIFQDSHPSNGSSSTLKDASRHFHSPLFEDIYRGEQFLNYCIAAGKSTSPNLQHSPISEKPSVQDLENQPSTSHSKPSYITCTFNYLMALLTLRLPRHCAVLLHQLHVTRALNITTSPYQIHAALMYPDILPSAKSVAIASRIQIAQHDRTPFPLVWALAEFAKIAFVIVQIEVTLFWNGVEGIGGVESMGHLIALGLGVLGLVWVVCRGIEEYNKPKGESRGAVMGDEAEVNFVAAYTEWRSSMAETREQTYVHPVARLRS